jgi:cyclic-di-GMP-binding protein
MSAAPYFQLPEIDPAARPEFADGPGARAWLEDMPLANVAATQRQLLLQVEALNRCAVGTEDRCAALEAVREAVNFVQLEQAKRFTGRAMPMLAAEAAVFEDTVELWEQMRLGYLRCLQEDAAQLRGQRALLCQRALAYSGLRMFHHYRAYRGVPARDWRGLHQAYAHAEALGVSGQAVKDYLNRDVHESSPRIAYLRALLLGLCSPHELAPRQLTFVAYLLERWADRVEVSKAPVAEGDLPPLAADLAGERGAERGEPRAGDLRYLDTRRLAKSLRNRVALLRKGESPARLALGEDCVQPSCEQLLVYLYRQWCQARPPRGAERRRVSDAVQACTGLPDIHRFVSGSPPAAGDRALEQWQLEDESAIGLRMVCRAGTPGRRLAHGQLVGVRAPGASAFQLAHVRWLTTDVRGELHCGLKLLPGVPQAGAVRGTGVSAADEKFVQAFELGAVPALNAPISLVVPPGWFRPKRVVEVVIDGKARKARLLEVLERGADFERLAYEAVSA